MTSTFDDMSSEQADPYGSYSAASGYGNDLETSLADDSRPRILLMGTRRAGKSSIQKVVFHKMSAHETLFLESTNEIRNRDISTSALVQFQLLDFPGNFDFQQKSSKITPDKIFKKTGALVFVIDAQDDETYSEAIDYFMQMAKLAYKINPKIHFDILIHKVDGDAYLSDDHKTDCQNEIKKSITEELQEAKLALRPIFHLTSIYDHTIFEAFSKIVQRLIPQLPLLEKLMDSLIGSCGMDKAFLFDVVSKIYVATDSNPVDMATYELCSDMIDVVIDVSCIYGVKGKGDVVAYDADSASVIKLSNNQILYLREVNKYLALVCLMRNDQFTKSGLVEYNFAQFKRAIAQLLEAKHKFKSENKEKDPKDTATTPEKTKDKDQQKTDKHSDKQHGDAGKDKHAGRSDGESSGAVRNAKTKRGAQ
jgi:Ras-related GTP-binding protein C/D